jgi:tetratricopeptide (TPR) repeat protein
MIMPNSAATAELPKALQSMIADAKKAVDSWQPNDDGDDPGMRAAYDWTLRLSRGEYDDRQYWECAAQDCEEAGDWLGAIAAYRKIVEIPKLFSLYLTKAHTSIGMVQCLLGDDRAALKSYRTAVSSVKDDVSVLQRTFIGNEIAQLLRMGQIRRARKLVQRGIASHSDESAGHFGMAMLLIRSAKCDLADGKLIEARQSLDCASQWLDAILQWFRSVSEDLEIPPGIRSAQVVWWFTEAERRRLAGEGESEIGALQRAIEEARLCFDACGWQVVWDDLRLMYVLDEIADAYDRHGKTAEANTARVEANEIFNRRHFPESAKRRERRDRNLWKSLFKKLSSRFRRA